MTDKLITPEFRGSFVSLDKPRRMKGDDKGDPQYQILIAIPKNDPFWNQAAAIVQQAAIEKWGKVPERLKTPIKDGDPSGYDNLIGHFFINARSDRRPGVVDVNLNPIMDAKELYSGAWYRVSINAYAWDHPTGGKGVSFALNNAMKIRDDEAFDGSTTAEQDFAGFAQQGGGAQTGRAANSLLPGGGDSLLG